MRRETRIRMQIDQALGAQGKRLAPTHEVTLINTALAMTAQGLGLAILPATMLPADPFPALIARPLTRPAITRPVSLLQRQGRSLSPAAQAFVATARTVLAQRTVLKRQRIERMRLGRRFPFMVSSAAPR
jgi:DNA-binding transcriptional LysR family regulator